MNANRIPEAVTVGLCILLAGVVLAADWIVRWWG